MERNGFPSGIKVPQDCLIIKELSPLTIQNCDVCLHYLTKKVSTRLLYEAVHLVSFPEDHNKSPLDSDNLFWSESMA